MTVHLYKNDGSEKYDLTQLVSTIEWSGSAASAGRTLQVEVVNAPYDTSISVPVIASGDYLSLVDDTEGEVFLGQIFGIERSSQLGTITYVAYDMMKNLLESKGQYVFHNVTPEAIAAQVCADVQVPVRYLYPTGVNIESLICDQMTLYDIIMAAYTKAYRVTRMQYFPMIYKRQFAVYSTVWVVNGMTLSDEVNIFASDISESVDELHNVVKIYDDNGTQIGQVSDADSIGVYGVFQELYKQEKGVDPVAAANNLLTTTPTQEIKVSALGDINALSNYYIQVTDGATGLSGQYWIASDTHKWEHGVHTMELELRFEALMDEKEGKES